MDRIAFGAAYYAEYQDRPDLEGDSVTVSTSTDTSAATRLHVLHNWSWDEATASPPGTMTDILSGERHPPGEKITLRAWDVRLFRSAVISVAVTGASGLC